ncbi:Lrp/AsnC family transcriptional regulator [Marinomonas sp. 15G1-11]|uniref:Lrp/AsnC family transcriptional regulator n=1 Tax=Marinomonas phaeophyticola TaxID=3004091 RepID=A0ABT4JTU1_9GAMM|nr:Lrp/AsnC family transcriptional regulator [Marinomonas sp. 15G1-11]MCZ2721808.1 Lrp/AsnC family transcriptional regulator [Marinomonas sp. 15G1-11]
MTEIHLDRTDYKIIRALEQDGRASNIQIADIVNLSQSQCLRRIRKLEENGVIDGYHAHINYEKLGYNIVAWSLVTVNKDLLNARDDVMRFLQEDSRAVSVFGVTGDVDLMVEIHVKDMQEFTDLIVKHLYQHPAVLSTKSYIKLDTAKLRGMAVTY